MFVDPSGMVIENELTGDNLNKFLNYLDKLKDADSFQILWTELNESTNVYKITSTQGISHFNKRDKTVYLNQDLPLKDFLEEMFHVYQEENIALYENIEVNIEFEAAVFVLSTLYVYIDNGIIGYQNLFVTDFVLGIIGDDEIIGLERLYNGIVEKTLMSEYIKYSNIFSNNQPEDYVNNYYYRQNTSSLPPSLTKIFKKCLLK